MIPMGVGGNWARIMERRAELKEMDRIMMMQARAYEEAGFVLDVERCRAGLRHRGLDIPGELGEDPVTWG